MLKMNKLFIRKYKEILLLPRNIKKYCTNTNTKCIYTEDYDVEQFCSLFVTCPFNIQIRPLDVHLYPNCDKIIVKLFSDDSTQAKVDCYQDRNQFSIFGESKKARKVSCLIETPVKSDINIIATGKANVDVSKLNGDKVLLQTEYGDILSDKIQTKKIEFNSKAGNIITLGTLHAGDIQLKTTKTGFINANHLQALKANISTENGDIKVQSSYCDETIFKTKSGKLELNNIHKKCSIIVLENGSLLMTGFDGTLDVKIKNGDVDIQASKLYDTSSISVEQKRSVLLRISEWIQDNTEIKTISDKLNIADSVQLASKSDDFCTILTPKNTPHISKLLVNCDLSKLNIEGASWSDMLKLKGINFSDL